MKKIYDYHELLAEKDRISDCAEAIGIPTCPKCNSENIKKIKTCKCLDCGYEAKIFPEYIRYKYSNKEAIARLKYWKQNKKKAIEFLKQGDVIKRLRKLSKIEIDELFHKCGWHQDGPEADGNKAFEDEILDAIKKSDKAAKIAMDNLFYDTPAEEIENEIILDFKKNLRDIEKE